MYEKELSIAVSNSLELKVDWDFQPGEIGVSTDGKIVPGGDGVRPIINTADKVDVVLQMFGFYINALMITDVAGRVDIGFINAKKGKKHYSVKLKKRDEPEYYLVILHLRLFNKLAKDGLLQ